MIGATPFYLYLGAESALFIGPRDRPTPWNKNDPANCASILNDLNKKPATPLIVLVDDASVSFHKETLPHLHFLDRRNLLKRRLSNAFRNSPLSVALPLKRETAVLAGLSQESTLNEWLSFLEQKIENPLGAVALMPLELSRQIMALCPAAKTKWCLFAAMQNKNFLRQTLFECGKPIYTRLTKVDDGQIEETIRATIHYAPRLGLKDMHDLSLVTLLPKNVGDAFEKTLNTIQLSADYDTFLAAWRKGRKIRHPIFSAQTNLSRWDRPIQQIGALCAGFVWLFVLIYGIQGGAKLYESNHKNTLLQLEVNGIATALNAEKTSPEDETIALLREAVARQRLFSEPHTDMVPLINALNQSTAQPFSSLTWTAQSDGSFVAELEPPLSSESELTLPSATVEHSETSTHIAGGQP